MALSLVSATLLTVLRAKAAAVSTEQFIQHPKSYSVTSVTSVRCSLLAPFSRPQAAVSTEQFIHPIKSESIRRSQLISMVG
jgi:hypothetical protein